MQDISIVLSTFNGAQFLPIQLESLVNQTLRPAELVVCDDRSTDGTWAILEEFQRRAPFPVRIYHNAINMGSSRSFEKAIRLAQGELIAPCDQDDIWHKEKLERLAAVMTDESVILTFCDARLVDGKGKPLGANLWQGIGLQPDMLSLLEGKDAAVRLLRQNVVTGAASMFRRHARGLILPMGGSWIHDYWYAVILALAGKIRGVTEPLWDYRIHGNNQIGVDVGAIHVKNIKPWRGAFDYSPIFHDSIQLAHLSQLSNKLAQLANSEAGNSYITEEKKRELSKLKKILDSHLMTPAN